jgi:hypothetical protein
MLLPNFYFRDIIFLSFWKKFDDFGIIKRVFVNYIYNNFEPFLHLQIVLVRLTVLWLSVLESLSEVNTRRLTSRITMIEGVAKVYLHQCVALETPGVRVWQEKSIQVLIMSSPQWRQKSSGLFKICVLLLINEFHYLMTLYEYEQKRSRSVYFS